MSMQNMSAGNSGAKARRYPIGAELIGDGVSFRVWAPAREKAWLVLEGGGETEMTRDEDGYFSLDVPGLKNGALYRFRLDGIDGLLADPASRYQPDGPEGPSMVVDPTTFRWTDDDWQGVSPASQVLYEMHVGTFTPEGTYKAATEKLPHLKDIGVTCIEMMPVNEFCGGFGWGYDGVLPYAPTRLYGTPDDLRSFIDTAHGLGIGVILDVVYNHFGNGERLADFTPDYFASHANEWGAAINFDGRNAHGVRTYIARNGAYWIDEYRFDGLRIDATQALLDTSETHILKEIAWEARRAAGSRGIYLVGENEPQDTGMVRPFPDGGYGLDALWNDDFHHSAVVALTGRNEAYYHDHKGKPQEFVSAAKYGYLFQGQRYNWQDAPRGRPGLDLRPQHFVHFIQNHDQIANSGTGERMHKLTSPGRMRAMTALLLLGPQAPMLFQGQEFFASSPFFYFADHSGDFGELVRRGRTEFLQQFPSLNNQAFVDGMAQPADPSTFERSKLDWAEAERNGHAVALHRDLLKLRRDDPTFRAGGEGRIRLDGSVLSESAFLLRYFGSVPQEDRLLLVNFGLDLRIESLPDPLFAPPEACQWQVLWSSEDRAYGGIGIRPMDPQARWMLTGECALVLRPERAERRPTPEGDAMKSWQTEISY
jgi:maltooligosyltrehalose trehalohydrolase